MLGVPRFEFSPRQRGGQVYTDIWPLRTSSPSLNKSQEKSCATPWAASGDEWRSMKKQPEVDGIKRWMQSNPELVRQMERRKQSDGRAGTPKGGGSSAATPRRAPVGAAAPKAADGSPRRQVVAQSSSQQLTRLIDAQHGFRPRGGARLASPGRTTFFPALATHRGTPYRDTGIRELHLSPHSRMLRNMQRAVLTVCMSAVGTGIPTTWRPATCNGHPWGHPG